MTRTTIGYDPLVTTALVEAATTASRYAPSVLNTQPWRWRVHPDRLELFAEPDRHLAATDPAGRSLTLSCGAALHHALVVLAAQGYPATVTRLPDPARRELLATVAPAGPAPVTGQTIRLLAAMRTRHTDRRPVADRPLPEATVRALGSAVADQARLHILTAEQTIDLAVAAEHANTVQTHDPRVCAELTYWTGPDAPQGTGIPAAVLPDRPPQTSVAGRDFGHPGDLTMGSGHDRAAVYALLYGDEDTAAAWLRAGEALSVLWLRATELGACLLPLSDVIEVGAARQMLCRRVLSGLGCPYLAVRLGIPDGKAAEPLDTPRIPAARVVDTSPLTAAGRTAHLPTNARNHA